jgi:hypothetical protein
MNRIKEIQNLHNKGFVILQAQRTTNAPIGWKRKDGSWGYVDEMNDKSLTRYKQSFSAAVLSRSHCGFYLGHNDLSCIDLDVKKTDEDVKAIVENIIDTFKGSICVETTKSNGYHIYFRFQTDLPNNPNFTQTDAKTSNWIEVYYRSRFIACYLSNSKRYNLVHGTIEELKPLTKEQHKKLIGYFKAYEGEKPKPRKSKPIKIDEDTMRRVVSYVEQIEAQQLDITGDNPKWFRIGKAFASAFGDQGFELFNRLSRFSPLYNADTIADDYQTFVDGDKRDRGQKITIATFFHICEEHGLLSLEALQAQKLHPAVQEDKEFTLTLSKKEKMAEHVHYLCEAFKEAVPICCIDKANFYVFDTTHWVLKNTREVLDLVKNFIDRTDVDPQFRSLLRTVPYLKMTLDELYLTTQRNALEPHTGDLKEGIFINMENGVLHINMQTGKRKLLDHDQKYNFTTLLPFSYEPTKACPKFDKWMEKQLPSKEAHIAYYAFVASCLTKHKADIIMLLAGETSTGKSSLIDVTRRLIGLDNSVAVSAGTLFSGKPEAAAVAMQMENKLLAYDFDAQPFRHLEMLLKVAAQEPLQGWQMHVTRRPVVNYGRLLIAMNPYNYSVFNAAVARRFITLNMNVKVEKDNNVMPAIFEELPGIFNHVLNIGIKHLIENNGTIKQTEELKKNTLQFHTGQRDAVRWFDSFYALPNRTEDKSNKLELLDKLKKVNKEPLVLKTVSELYREFRLWCEDVEGYPQSKIPLRKHFAQDLELVNVRDEVFKIGGKPVRGLYLIRF